MNKLTTSLALISTMFMAGTSYAADVIPGVNARTESGTIYFSGQVVGVTCTIGSEGKYTQKLLLDPVLRSKLKTRGAVAEPKDFKIEVTGCDAQDTVEFKFTPDPVNTDTTTGNLINQAANGAVGAQIQILKNDMPINFNDAQLSENGVVDSSGNTSFKFKAQYYAAQSNVTLGDVQTSVGFTLDYK